MHIQKELQALSLPAIYQRNGTDCFLDPYREKLIPATPEEYVRQRVAAWLEKVLAVPNQVILVEQHLSHYGIKSKDRADIVVHRETSNGLLPLAVIECKADSVFISEATIHQAMRYADAMECNFMFLTNGIEMLCYKYDEEKNQYFELSSMPTYEDMLAGKATYMPPPNTIIRPSLEQAYDKNIQEKYLDEWIIGTATNKHIVPYIINLFECLMDGSHHLPQRTNHGFALIQDYGVRMMSYGNAAGYTYYAPYRSFLICDEKRNHQFVSIGFNAYGNDKTILCVAIDDYKKSHHALQLLIDTYMDIKEQTATIWHNGRIAVGHQGSGKAAELKKLIFEKCPALIHEDKIQLGSISLNRLLYLDESDVCDFIYNLINYALLRDEYRSSVRQKRDEK